GQNIVLSAEYRVLSDEQAGRTFMTSSSPQSADSALGTQHPALMSALRAFGVLVVQSFQRHWRVRQMGWVSFALLALVVGWVGVVTASPAGWDLPGQRVPRTRLTHAQAAEQLTPTHRYFERNYRDEKGRPLAPWELPAPLTPTRDAIQNLVLSIPHAVLTSQKFVQDWGFMNFSRWVMLGAFLGFVLPLFTLSYASAAFGTER